MRILSKSFNRMKILCFAVVALFFFNHEAFAELKKFDIEMAVMEANFEKDSNLSKKLWELSDADLEKVGMAPATASQIKDFWWSAAIDSCSLTIENEVKKNLRGLNHEDMNDPEKLEAVREKASVAIDWCKYRFYHSHWSQIKEMIEEKYHEYKCGAAAWYSPRRFWCLFSGY